MSSGTSTVNTSLAQVIVIVVIVAMALGLVWLLVRHRGFAAPGASEPSAAGRAEPTPSEVKSTADAKPKTGQGSTTKAQAKTDLQKRKS